MSSINIRSAIAWILWFAVTLTAVASLAPLGAQTTSNETVCTLTVNDKGEQVFRCAFPSSGPATPTPAPTQPDKDAADYYVKCESKTGNRWTTLAIEPLEAELRFVDKAQITNDNTGQPAIWNDSNVPLAAYVKYKDWLLLPVERRWGAIRRQPPTQNQLYMVTGSCMSALAAKLKLNTEEPY